jgi:hypothetical protein
VVGDGRRWEGGEERLRSAVLMGDARSAGSKRETERELGEGWCRSVGRLVGGDRSVGRWRCMVERERFGKWGEILEMGDKSSENGGKTIVDVFSIFSAGIFVFFF